MSKEKPDSISKQNVPEDNKPLLYKNIGNWSPVVLTIDGILTNAEVRSVVEVRKKEPTNN